MNCAACLSIALFALPLFLFASSLPMSRFAEFEITQTWNGQPIPSNSSVSITLSYEQDLVINVSSPFYDDPKLPDMTQSPGTMDKLYNYEVVEVFLLGSDDHYLEIELGPRGQYLLLELKGYRNTIRYPIPLKFYRSQITDKRWKGTAVVAHENLPGNITRFNAYAIHSSGDKRTYLSLFPAPHNHPNYTKPDFHRLELFQEISIFQN